MRRQSEKLGITQTAVHILPRMGKSIVDFGFAVDEFVSIRIVIQPGLWLKPDKLNSLLKELNQVILETIPGGLDYGIVKGDKWCLDHSVISVLYDRRLDRPIGFNAFCLLEIDFRDKPIELLHLGLVVINPKFQASGYSWVLCGLPCLLIFLRNGGRSMWVSSVSQVPAVLGTVSKGFDNVFPLLSAESHRSFDHVIIAREIMKHYRHVFGVGEEAEFDEYSFVIRNAYTGGSQNLKKTLEATAKSHNENVNEWCKNKLDYIRGDDVLQVGALNISVAMGYLFRTVPNKSILYLLYRLFFVVGGTLFFQVMQWLSPKKQFGDLRPRR